MDSSKPFVVSCNMCEREFPEVHKQIKLHLRDIDFTASVCKRHYIEFLKRSGTPPERIKEMVENRENNGGFKCPDLKEHPELVKLYSQGIFLPNKLRERLQKLANII